MKNLYDQMVRDEKHFFSFLLYLSLIILLCVLMVVKCQRDIELAIVEKTREALVNEIKHKDQW